ncbi:unnamed protein product [Rhizoctonia solani]|uniref:Uncharacterized protein n=1 Tax=Rhizoctonia solani TaxID=456999 RepID=A0A8H3DPS2_9AGAM|nr:unnamed protein product [Rhizoctonia solani]
MSAKIGPEPEGATQVYPRLHDLSIISIQPPDLLERPPPPRLRPDRSKHCATIRERGATPARPLKRPEDAENAAGSGLRTREEHERPQPQLYAGGRRY